MRGGKRWRRKKLKVQGIRSQKEDDTLFIRIQKHQGKILHIYLDLLVKNFCDKDEVMLGRGQEENVFKNPPRYLLLHWIPSIKGTITL